MTYVAGDYIVKYAYIPYANTIISLDNSQITPRQLRMINRKETPIELSDNKWLNQNNIVSLELHDFVSMDFDDKVKVVNRELLPILNKKLSSKCTDLTFTLDFYYNLTTKHIQTYSASGYPGTLVLCLNNPKRNCISSIELLPKDGSNYELNSFTLNSYKNKKYNKLLRAACILIVSHLGGSVISSVATNPVSAYTMIKHFGAFIDTTSKYNDPVKAYLKNKRSGEALPNEIQTLRDFEEYQAQQNKDFIAVTFIDVNNSKDYFDEYLKEIECM